MRTRQKCGGDGLLSGVRGRLPLTTWEISFRLLVTLRKGKCEEEGKKRTHISYNYLEIPTKCLLSMPNQMFSNINAIFNGCRKWVLWSQSVTHRDGDFASGICVPLQDSVRPVAIAVSDRYFLERNQGSFTISHCSRHIPRRAET